MAEASVAFALGLEAVTSVLEIDLVSGGTPLVGDVSGTFADCFVAGDVNQTGDVIIEDGQLTGLNTFAWEGNGFQLLFHNGGRPNLAGVEKTAWLRGWDLELPVGWQLGDRLMVAPTVPGVFLPTETIWMGSWQSTTRPANSPDVMLPNGQIVGPEVANLSQTIVFKNLRRIHFHDGAGIATLKWLKVLNCGTAGVLGDYPLHFHLNGDASRGSLIEQVVVEGGKNHAFVPHGSHGITYRGVVAVNTTGDTFWWDFPLDKDDISNNSDDITIERPLIMLVQGTALRRSGFILGAGSGNSITYAVACCVQGGKDAAGFHWIEAANQNEGGNVWDAHHLTTHNNKNDGVNVWQNDPSLHVVADGIAYHNGLVQIDHGAYGNRYTYQRWVLKGGSEAAFKWHAVGPITLEDIIADRRLLIVRHQSGASEFATVRRCQFGSPGSRVHYRETGNGGFEPSRIRYEDTGWIPADFDFDINDSGIVVSTLIEITEGGVLTHRWAAGAWA